MRVMRPVCLTLPPPERELCTQCLRASAVCFCEELAPFKLPFQIVILQHPKERKNSIGTARLTHLSLEGSLLFGGVGFDDDERVNSILDSPEHHCVLLYPGSSALDLGTHGQQLLNSDTRLVIFVIDGTWAHAKTMLRKSSRILALPRVAFDSPSPSEYQVRRQPYEFCLSTVEAVHRLVQILHPVPAAEHLMVLFRKLVQQQIKFAASHQLRELRGNRQSLARREQS